MNRTILAPEKRVQANADDHRFRGLEIAPRSKSSDVYLTIRVNAKLALYIRALAFSMGRDLSDQTEGFVRFAVHNEFCARGCPEWRGEFVESLMKLNDREALAMLLDRCISATPITKGRWHDTAMRKSRSRVRDRAK